MALGKALKDMYKNYKDWIHKAKQQGNFAKENFSYKKIIDTFKINTFSVLSINKALYQLKKKRNITKVISIGSSSALNGFKDTYSYCGSKHALLGIIKSLNETIYNKNIFNYCLNFGSIKNKMEKKLEMQIIKNLLIKILL